MIMIRTPFRVSFAGGGSDLRDFYSAVPRGGAVLSTTIDKYMYVMIHTCFHEKIRIKYSKTEDVGEVDQIVHPLVRESLRMVGIAGGVEIASMSDVPSGTGVGSSSTFTVCLLHALHTYQRRAVSKELLARGACRIEIDILKEPIGKQDQYAASYGGINFIRFAPDDSVVVEPVVCSPDVLRSLQARLMLFYVGNDRAASEILNEQKANMKQAEKSKTVEQMVDLANQMHASLIRADLDEFGDLLHEGWMLKRQVASRITNPLIDAYYEKARTAGASGGKLLGAGGGGFLLIYCPADRQVRVREELGLRELRFAFDRDGSRVMYSE